MFLFLLFAFKHNATFINQNHIDFFLSLIEVTNKYIITWIIINSILIIFATQTQK